MGLNFLLDEIVPVEKSDGSTAVVALPAALSGMADGSIRSLREVRAHQRHALHMFLVQAAVMAIESAGGDKTPLAPSAVWERRLLALAPVEAWELVQNDSSKPAFMQPPMSLETFEEASSDRKSWVYTPDEITLLIQSKNHSTKFSTMVAPSPWQWAVALIEVQTIAPYKGPGLYGTSRMNGGYGTRFQVGIYSDMTPSAMWLRDVRAVQRLLPSIIEAVPAYSEPGQKQGALWVLPWDGTDYLPLSQVHPLFIDISRRYRLVRVSGNSLGAIYTTSRCRRVLDPTERGLLGDPWTPINAEAQSAISLKRLDAKTLCDLIFNKDGHYQKAPLQEIGKDDTGDLFFHACAVIGGQCKTEGFAERTVPIPGKIRSLLFAPEGGKRLGETSAGMIADVDKAWGCIRKAIFGMVQVARTEIKWKDHAPSDAAASRAREHFKAAYEEKFFSELWKLHLDGDKEAWIASLREMALSTLDWSVLAFGARTQLEYKAKAKASGMFNGLWNKEFGKEKVAA